MSKRYPGPYEFVPKNHDHPLMSGVKGRIFTGQLPIRDSASFREAINRDGPVVSYDAHRYRRVDGILSVIYPKPIVEGNAMYVASCMTDLCQFGLFVEKTWKRISKPEDLPDYAKVDLERIVKNDLEHPYVDMILKGIYTDIEYIAYRLYDDDYFTNCGYDPYAMHGVTMSS